MDNTVRIILFAALALTAFVLGFLNFKGIIIHLTLTRRRDRRSKGKLDNIGRGISYFLIGLACISYIFKDYWGGITTAVLLISGGVLATVMDIIVYIKRKRE